LDWKTSLQERSAELSLGVPEYRVTEEGPDHAKVFQAKVLLSGSARGEGSGRTKKEAEQHAAAAAYTSLQAAPANGQSSSGDVAGAQLATPTCAPMTDSLAIDSVAVTDPAQGADSRSVGNAKPGGSNPGGSNPSEGPQPSGA
jgi:ribonuclease-3